MQPGSSRLLMPAICTLAVALAVGGAFLSLRPAQAASVDVVNGVAPVYQPFFDDGLAINQKLASMGSDQERMAYLSEHYPHLDDIVIDHLRQSFSIPLGAIVAKVEFHFGSSDDVTASTGDNKRVRGYFKDQLVAYVTLAGEDAPRLFAVQCTNGMALAIGASAPRLQALVSYDPVQPFTVEQGRGLAFYTKDFPKAIAIARACNFPLYLERGTHQPISAEQALATDTDWKQVTVGVKPGTWVDPQNLVCRG